MNNQKRNVSGFSVIELLIVIVVLSLLGFAGWKVYNNQKAKTAATKVSTTTSTTASSNASKEIYSVVDQSLNASSYPNDWTYYVDNTFSTTHTERVVLASPDARYQYVNNMGIQLTLVSGAEIILEFDNKPNTLKLSDYQDVEGTPNNHTIVKKYSNNGVNFVEYLSGGWESVGPKHNVDVFNSQILCHISIDASLYTNTAFAKEFNDVVASINLK